MEAADTAVVPGLRPTVWDQHNQKVTYPKLEKEASADVIVVGAGISRLSIAYNLLKAGKSVIVLESRVVGAGQTGKSTTHIMPWFDDYYHLVEKLHGFYKAKQVAASYLKAIDWIEQTVNELTGFPRVDGHLYPHDDSSGALDRLQKVNFLFHLQFGRNLRLIRI